MARLFLRLLYGRYALLQLTLNYVEDFQQDALWSKQVDGCQKRCSHPRYDLLRFMQLNPRQCCKHLNFSDKWPVINVAP